MHADAQESGGSVDVRSEPSPLAALLTLARLGRNRPLDEVLEAVARTVAETLHYGTVVMNVYRPSHDDYTAELVHGDDDARRVLLGTSNSHDTLHREVMAERFERLPGVFFVPEGEASWDEIAVHDPVAWSGEGPDAWLSGDALLVRLATSDGTPLGILSVDEPASGIRPDAAELELLAAVAAHAATALERAQLAEEDARHQRALTTLVGLGAQLADSRDAEQVAARTCDAAVLGLGFTRGAVYERRGEIFTRQAECGDAEGCPEVLEAAAVLRLLRGAAAEPSLVDGHFWVPGGAPVSVVERSGPWGPDYVLLVPMLQLDGTLIGVILLDGPAERMTPSGRRRQELRLLANEAVAAIGFVERRNALSHQASHDALTGLRNRRDLEAIIDRLAAQPRGVAVLLCDLDRFKATNDTHGHETGDRVLERFADLLREHAREGDLAVRFGGEEFCLVLPGAGLAEAAVVAERIRSATPDQVASLVPRQTVSVGFAAVSPEHRDGTELLAAADAALYEAKAGGRDAAGRATRGSRRRGVRPPWSNRNVGPDGGPRSPATDAGPDAWRAPRSEDTGQRHPGPTIAGGMFGLTTTVEQVDERRGAGASSRTANPARYGLRPGSRPRNAPSCTQQPVLTSRCPLRPCHSESSSPGSGPARWVWPKTTWPASI